MRRGAGTRREFLKAAATTGAGLVIGFYLPGKEGSAQAAVPTEPFVPNGWIRIAASGEITILVEKDEIGQGIFTALPMIVAEELEVDWKQIRVEHAPTNPRVYKDLNTGGSGSVNGCWDPLRQAGATARTLLVQAAAKRWSAPEDACRAVNSRVLHAPTGRMLSYGELAEAAAQLPIPKPESVHLKDPKDYRLIGKPAPRTDTPSKVDGSAIYGIDFRVPEMRYAVIARCPYFGGKALRVDSTKAKAMPGVRAVVEIPAMGPPPNTAGGVAVVADSTWAAMEGRRALEVEWDHGPNAGESTESLRAQYKPLARAPAFYVARNEGDADAALAAAARTHEAAYEMPFLAHATMEPMNCTAYAREDGLDIWAPTQAPQYILSIAAKRLNYPPEKVRITSLLSGGGFGRRYQSDYAVEAAQVSRAAGCPVKVVWTREDDMQHDFYRQANYHRMRAGLDAQGKVVAWSHRIVSTSIRQVFDPPERLKDPKRVAQQEMDGARGLPYDVPNLRVDYVPALSGVPRAWWRSVADSFNGFAVESFVDELANAAGADPLAFRLKLLEADRKVPDPMSPDDPPADTKRLRDVLRFTAEKAGWGKPLPKGWGRGIAGYYSFDTYVAQVAEVSVEKGELRVHRVVAGVDCGRVVNPNIAAAQTEGGIIFGLTAALRGEITIAGGAVRESNFDDYPILRINEMPEIQVHFVESSEHPTGLGEPAVPVIAPAVANAISVATGKRLRRLPIRDADLQQG
jgi:isoquinoline 1-oxidoreductase beta subunit